MLGVFEGAKVGLSENDCGSLGCTVGDTDCGALVNVRGVVVEEDSTVDGDTVDECTQVPQRPAQRSEIKIKLNAASSVRLQPKNSTNTSQSGGSISPPKA